MGTRDKKFTIWSFLSFISLWLLFFGLLAWINWAVSIGFLTFVSITGGMIKFLFPEHIDVLRKLWNETIIREAHIVLFILCITPIIVAIYLFLKDYKPVIKLEKR